MTTTTLAPEAPAEAVTEPVRERRHPRRATMTAAVLAAPGEVRLETVPRPQPGPGKAVVRLAGCGLCASSLPLWQGRPWFEYPRPAGEPGHEGWGWVEATGDGVTAVREGDRVAILSGSAFAEADVAPATSLVPLDGLPATEPFPGEAFGCGWNAFERSAIGPGDTVAVVGVGFLGGLLVRLAAARGVRVVAVSRRASSRELGLRLGAVEALDVDDPDAVVAAVEERTGGALCAVVVEATGHQQPLDLAARLTATRGRLVIAGYHQDGPRQVDLQLWNWRGIDVVNAHERDPERYAHGVRGAVAAARRGELEPAALVTHELPLARLGDAFELLARRPDGFVKAWVRTGEAS